MGDYICTYVLKTIDEYVHTIYNILSTGYRVQGTGYRVQGTRYSRVVIRKKLKRMAFT